jgi:hypothetical protein
VPVDASGSVIAARPTPAGGGFGVATDDRPPRTIQLQARFCNRFGGARVPAWTYADYDSLYVVRLGYVGHTITARFQRDHEGLNDQPRTCLY